MLCNISFDCLILRQYVFLKRSEFKCYSLLGCIVVGILNCAEEPSVSILLYGSTSLTVSRFTQNKMEAVYFPEKSISFYNTVPEVGIRYIK